MSRPSLRLRALTRAMRLVVKPKLKRTGTPERANRDFERVAPILFSKPKGMQTKQVGNLVRVTVGQAHESRAILYIHGGAFVTGSAKSYAAMAGRLAKRTGAQVFLADYPLLQEAPFPAAPTAVLAAWEAMLAAGWLPHQIIIGGDSAGGNLVFGLLSTVLQRGEQPAGIFAFSPWTDLTLSGETITLNAKRDPLIPVSRMQEAVDLYLNGADPKDVRASPLFGEYSAPPPVLIQVGQDEVLFSDSKRMAEKTKATLSVWPHCPHVWQIFDGRLPEAKAAMREVAKFVQTSFDKASL